MSVALFQNKEHKAWNPKWPGVCVPCIDLVFIVIYSPQSLMLWLMPPGDSMEKGKGYDNMIGCAIGSLSQYLI